MLSAATMPLMWLILLIQMLILLVTFYHPHHLADAAFVSPQVQAEANALCAFKQGITNWPGKFIVTSGWNCNISSTGTGSNISAIATTHPCGSNVSWAGITCSGSSVTRIFINSCGFQGTIASSLSTLTALSVLSLRISRLSGPIPTQLGTLTNMVYFNLRSNLLSGTIPLFFSNFTKMTEFYIRDNILTGSLPTELSVLSKVEAISWGDNVLTGPIPYQYSALASLSYIRLYSNRLTGPIPSQLSILHQMSRFDLFDNLLTSSIPSELSTWTLINFLHLENNMISSTIPSFISDFHYLAELCLSSNKLIGTMPDIFGKMGKLELLQASNNLLTGVLPPSLASLRSSLLFADFSMNNLRGYPFFFLGFPKMRFANMSHNKFGSNTNDLSSDFITPNLRYLDMSSNVLHGTLPSNIGLMFPALTLLIASENCFDTFIPESLCRARNLTTVLMNKLGSQCASTDVSVMINSFSRNIQSTIPSCVLALPFLKTAHFIGNHLFGTISEVSASLESLSLVGNVLEGSIPHTIQQSFNLTELQLSLNRLSGTLMEDAFGNLPPDSIIELYSNRVSGDIPSSLSAFDVNHVDILAGNLFYCDSKNPVPSNLKGSLLYACGSSSIDYYGYIYIAVAVCVVVGSTMLTLALKKKVDYRHLSLLLSFYRKIPFPTPIFSAANNQNPRFSIVCLSVALLMTLLNVVLRGDFYSTHYDEYGWTAAFIFVHGVLPFVLIFVSLFVTLFAFFYYIKKETTSTSLSASKISDASDRNALDRSSPDSSDRISYTPSEQKKHKAVSFIVDLFYSANYRLFFCLQIINIAVVTGINVLYVVLENDNDSISVSVYFKLLAPIFLSLFKMVWYHTFLVQMLKYGIASKIPEHQVFGHCIFASLYLYVLVPIVTVYTTDVNCFYYKIEPIPSITESYEGIVPSTNCERSFNSSLGLSCDTSYPPVEISKAIVPSWIYSYQCGFSILIKYIPSVLATYTVAGILIPIVKLVLLCMPPSTWVRNTYLARLFLPLTFNVNPGEEMLHNSDKRQFRTYRYLSRLIKDIVMMLTFGIFCPFLVFMIFASIAINEVVNHLQLGSYFHDKFALTSKNTTTNNNCNIEKEKVSDDVKLQARPVIPLLPGGAPHDDDKNLYGGNHGVVTFTGISPMVEMVSVVSKPTTDSADLEIARGVSSCNMDASSSNETSDDGDIANKDTNNKESGNITIVTANSVVALSDIDSALQTSNDTRRRNEEEISADKDGTLQMETLNLYLSSVYLGNSLKLYRSVWKLIVLVILLFATLILFDIVADVYHNTIGLVSVAIFWFVMILCFYSRKRLVKIESFMSRLFRRCMPQ